MNAGKPKSRLPYVYTWVVMTAVVALLIYIFQHV